MDCTFSYLSSWLISRPSSSVSVESKDQELDSFIQKEAEDYFQSILKTKFVLHPHEESSRKLIPEETLIQASVLESSSQSSFSSFRKSRKSSLLIFLRLKKRKKVQD